MLFQIVGSRLPISLKLEFKKKKKLTLPLVRRNSSCLTASKWNISLFLALDSSRSISSSWVWNLLAFRLELTPFVKQTFSGTKATVCSWFQGFQSKLKTPSAPLDIFEHRSGDDFQPTSLCEPIPYYTYIYTTYTHTAYIRVMIFGKKKKQNLMNGFVLLENFNMVKDK